METTLDMCWCLLSSSPPAVINLIISESTCRNNNSSDIIYPQRAGPRGKPTGEEPLPPISLEEVSTISAWTWTHLPPKPKFHIQINLLKKCIFPNVFCHLKCVTSITQTYIRAKFVTRDVFSHSSAEGVDVCAHSQKSEIKMYLLQPTFGLSQIKNKQLPSLGWLTK